MTAIYRCAAHGKEAFSSRKKARSRLRDIKRQPLGLEDKRPCRYYFAPDCGFWHLTSKPAGPGQVNRSEKAARKAGAK